MYTVESITQKITELSAEEKQQLFQLLFTHSNLLDKLLPGLPLVDHVTGQRKLTHALGKEYTSWLKAKT